MLLDRIFGRKGGPRPPQECPHCGRPFAAGFATHVLACARTHQVQLDRDWFGDPAPEKKGPGKFWTEGGGKPRPR